MWGEEVGSYGFFLRVHPVLSRVRAERSAALAIVWRTTPRSRRGLARHFRPNCFQPSLTERKGPEERGPGRYWRPRPGASGSGRSCTRVDLTSER